MCPEIAYNYIQCLLKHGVVHYRTVGVQNCLFNTRVYPKVSGLYG